jgi:hypothetical protein
MSSYRIRRDDGISDDIAGQVFDRLLDTANASPHGHSPKNLRMTANDTATLQQNRNPSTHSIARGHFIRYLGSASGANAGQLGL